MIILKKKSIYLTLLFAVMMTLTACSNNDSEAPLAEETTSTSEVNLPIVDRAGNSIEVPEKIETIVSLAPSITQILEDLGVKNQIVAIDTQSPPLVDGLDELPQLDMMNPNIEMLLALNPDIIFASGISFGLNENIFDLLIDNGITVVHIPTSSSIDEIKEDIQFIADCLQLTEKGTVLNQELQETIEKIAAIGDTITERKTVLFEISPLPDIFSFGNGVFLHEMIEIIGAENVLGAHENWLPVTEESAVDSDPDVILTNVNFIEDPVAEILGRNGWSEMTAIQNKNVFYIDNGYSSLPNHRIVEALKEMALAIYPEEFANIFE